VILPARPDPREPRRLPAAGYSSFLSLVPLLVLVLTLGACATPQVSSLLQRSPDGLPRQAEIAGVPFHAQEDYQCGPAALAMVLDAAGTHVTPDDLKPLVYLPGLKGSLQVEMMAGARRNGFVAVTLAPKLDQVLTEVAAGHPVIVLQNLGLDWIPVWHYAVVIGYDLDRQSIVLRSGRERRQELTLVTFERTWARGAHWAMLAMPTAARPVTVSEGDYLKAVAALEPVNAVAARNAYETALLQWPANLLALIGVANTAYATGHLHAAEQALEEATRLHPESAVAFNNLAQVLFELGRRDEALVAVGQALRLGGARFAPARNTLAEIQR
jgi:tetratricopeptide (TPR) repeat protein